MNKVLIFLKSFFKPKKSEEIFEDENITNGLLKYKQNDFCSAINYFNSALINSPDDGNIYYLRAKAKFAMDDLAGAIEDYSKVIEKSPEDIYYYERGMIRYFIHDWEGAIEDFTNIIELNPANENAYIRRAELRFLMCQGNFAILDLERASELGSKYAKKLLKKKKR